MPPQLSINPYDNLPVAVYTCDENGYLTSFNKAAEHIWGRIPEIGIDRWKGAWRLLDEDGKTVPPEHHPVALAIKGRKVITQAEFTIQQPDASAKNVQISSVPTFDEFGNITGVINMLIDITEQKRDEARQAMLASIIEYSEDAIISKSLDGIITTWNQAAENMFGYKEYEAIGRHISLIIPDERKEEEQLIIGKIKNGESVEHFETVRIDKDHREIPISLTVSPLRNKKGLIIGASKIVRDITRQKDAEEELRHYTIHLEELVEERTTSLNKTVVSLQQTQEDLSRSLEKEKELGQLKSRFVSMASHEFRTPLSAIKLSGSLIDKYVPNDNENVRKHTHKIKSAVSNLTSILNDFLSLEKLETGKVEVNFENFDLVGFAEEITEEMQLMAKQGQFIVYQHSGVERSANLDANLLRNCIINLISNAIKYSGENSFIEFETEINEREYLVTVKDNGIGIPEKDQKHLFEPFFRAHNTGNIQGTGLGLNIVARYTDLMRGSIDFKSELSNGTKFTLRFPVKN